MRNTCCLSCEWPSIIALLKFVLVKKSEFLLFILQRSIQRDRKVNKDWEIKVPKKSNRRFVGAVIENSTIQESSLGGKLMIGVMWSRATRWEIKSMIVSWSRGVLSKGEQVSATYPYGCRAVRIVHWLTTETIMAPPASHQALHSQNLISSFHNTQFAKWLTEYLHFYNESLFNNNNNNKIIMLLIVEFNYSVWHLLLLFN